MCIFLKCFFATLTALHPAALLPSASIGRLYRRALTQRAENDTFRGRPVALPAYKSSPTALHSAALSLYIPYQTPAPKNRQYDKHGIAPFKGQTVDSSTARTQERPNAAAFSNAAAIRPNRLHPGICTGTISAKQPSRRPFRLYLAIPLCRRCSDAPDCPLYHPRSDAPVTLPLRPCLDAIPLFRCAAPFRSNSLHCGIAPLEGGSPP